MSRNWRKHKSLRRFVVAYALIPHGDSNKWNTEWEGFYRTKLGALVALSWFMTLGGDWIRQATLYDTIKKES